MSNNYERRQYTRSGCPESDPTDRVYFRKPEVPCKEEEHERCDCPKHTQPGKIILECGTNPQDAIFEIDDEDVEENQCFTLDRVVIDTSCLCRPQVKIEFSSLVVFEVEDENGDGEREIKVDLLFELIRVCDGDEEVLQSWRYLKGIEVDTNELEVEISEPFTVTFCDRNCPGCCTYKVKVKGIDFEGDFEALRVVKPDLSALAQGNLGCSK